MITPKNFYDRKNEEQQRFVHVKFVTSELNVEEKCKAKRKVQIQPRNMPYHNNYHLFKRTFSSYVTPLVALLLLLCVNCDIC